MAITQPSSFLFCSPLIYPICQIHRNSGMPISRAKSCDHCRVAKTRCSLATPCSRCAKRGLECHYSSSRSRSSNPQRWKKEFRTILPVTTDLGTAEHITGDSDPHIDYLQVASMIKASDTILPGTLSTAAEISFPNSVSTSEDNAFADIARLVDTGAETPDLTICHSDTPSLFDISGTSRLSHAATPESKSLGSSDNGSMYPYYVDPLSTYNPFNFPYPFVTGLGSASSPVLASIDFSSPELLTEAANVLRKPYLSTRERSFQQGYLTGKMLLSQMIDYTHRMAEGKTLPPFIHPPCFLSQDNECPPDTPHTCLPKILAICRTMTQMFYSRTPETNAFIWDQIYSHLRQMYAEVSSLFNSALTKSQQGQLAYAVIV